MDTANKVNIETPLHSQQAVKDIDLEPAADERGGKLLGVATYPLKVSL